MKEVQAGSVDQLRFLSSLMSSRCLLCHKTASWLVVVAFLVLFLPIASSSSFCVVGADVSRQHDGCISFADFGGSFFSQQNYYRLRDVCSGSGTFCFPSTLVDFIGEKDGEQVYTFRVSKGTVSCSLMDFVSGTHGEQAFSKEMDALEIVDFCEASIVSDIWMRTQPNAWYNDLDEHLDEAEVGILGSFPSLAIDIKPSMLDWETKNLYSPSLKILKVVNRHNNSVLRVFDIFSTNTQFVVYGFQTLSLEPGKSASIPFIFIPRWLGLSLAQLVLQTSFGGFVIHAKGIAISSPYQVQPLAGLSISMSERLNGNLSIFNPSTDFLYVKELAAWILFSGSEKDHLAHIFCTTNEFQQSTSELSSPMGSDWYVLKSGKVGSPRMNIWLHQQLEVQPNKAETILKLNLWPHLAKKISGSICMKLGNSSHDKFDTVIVPLDIEMNQIESYSHSSGSLSLYFNTLTPCNGRNTIFALSLRNDAPCLLSIIKISEVTKGCRLLEIRYMEGLLVFPGTVTQIALITYVPSLDSQDRVSEIHSTGLNCMLTIKTNDSLNPVMNIPCDDLIRKSCKYEGVVQMLDIESSSATLMEKQENEKSANTRAASLGNDIKESLSRKAKPLDLIEIDDLILDNWRSHATTSKLSVLQDQEILFPVVQIGSHFLKWIRVHNPSEKPVVMQLVLNSGVIIDHCISHDDLSEHTILPKFSVIDSAEIRVGFSMAETAVTEAFVHPLRSALFGPVIFRPSSHCMWRSTALIRNNLSGVEWLPLQAFGGSHSLLLLEGSDPIFKLDFKFHLPITSNVSSSDFAPPIQSSSSFCSNLLHKEIHAKNTGELPLEVIKLKVSGVDCGCDGFTIHNCKGFVLAPGESTKLLISYQADFSTSVLHRDLELAMATGILVIPMRASIPVYMLNLCRKAIFSATHWKVLLLLIFSSFLLQFMIRNVPQVFSSAREDYFSKFRKTTNKAETSAQFQQNARKFRSSRQEKTIEAAYFKKYSDCLDDGHDSSKNMVAMQRLDNQKNARVSPRFGNSLMEVANNSQSVDATQNCSLTIRIMKDKVRRRKRRSTGAVLAAKLDVSSSQSGNSTPSSPLSPTLSTPKQLSYLSSDTIEHLCIGGLEEVSHVKQHGFNISSVESIPESANCSDKKQSSMDRGVHSTIANLTGKPSLLLSATFPGPGWRAPDMTASSFLTSTSPIAPYARAPGSKLSKSKTMKGDEKNEIRKDFTYDIWGHHLSDQMFSRPKESTSKLSVTSEGDSQSFFIRDPQSLMMMSLAQSVSPGLESPSSGVNYLDEMN